MEMVIYLPNIPIRKENRLSNLLTLRDGGENETAMTTDMIIAGEKTIFV